MMFARMNRDGASVNESALCEECIEDETMLFHSYALWLDAEDTDPDSDPVFAEVDNSDAVCGGCARPADKF